MRQILSRRDVRADRWRYPGDAAETGEAGAGPLVRTLAELLANPNTASGELGVRLSVDENIGKLSVIEERKAVQSRTIFR